MMWFLICLGVFIAAFVMWKDISPQLPKSLRLPSSASAVAATPSSAAPTDQPPAIGPDRWSVVSAGNDFRASREFITPVTVDGTTYYPPILGLSCYHGKLYAWVDTSLRAPAAAGHPERIPVRLDGEKPELWLRGPGTVIESPDPRHLADDILAHPTLTISVAIGQRPERSYSLESNGLQILQAQIASCSAAPLAAGT